MSGHSEGGVPAAARDWVIASAGSGVAAATVLPGGVTAAVWSLDMDRGEPLVLKLFDQKPFVEENPDRAEHEAAALDSLGDTPVPVPRVVAVDADGSEAGHPAVLMTRVAGEMTIPVPDPVEAAGVAAGIHRIEVDVPWRFRRYNRVGTTQVPPWGDRALWDEAIAAVSEPEPDGPTTFIHRDFHHYNLIWSGGRVAGVVDWLSACMGPPGIDLARFTLNTVFDGHPEVGEAFVAAYRAVGPDGVHHSYWDLVDAIDMVPFYEDDPAVAAWPGEDGDPSHRAKVEDFVRAALQAL